MSRRRQHDLESDATIAIASRQHQHSPTTWCIFISATLLLSLATLYLPFGIARWRKAQLIPIASSSHSQFDRLLLEVLQENALHQSRFTITVRERSCSNLRRRLNDVEYIESGWTKAIFKATVDGERVALKVPDYTSTDTRQCMAEQRAYLQDVDDASAFHACYRRSLKKMLKELVLYDVLAHDNVVKVLHYCADDDLRVPEHVRDLAGRRRVELLQFAPLIVVTELGNQLELIKLLQLKWEDRLRIAQNIGQLLVHLASNEHGISAQISDFRASQFVHANDGSLRLTDLDDVSTVEPACDTDNDCQQPVSNEHEGNALLNSSVRCVKARCVGHNERRNLGYAAAQFDSLFLVHGAPTPLRVPMQRFYDHLVAGQIANAQQLLLELNRIVSLWSSGSYLHRSLPAEPQQYALLSNATAGSDYRCRYELRDSHCLLSVFDALEAADLCDADPLCNGYVVLPRQHWAQRLLVVLKKDVDLTMATFAPDVLLFARRTSSSL